MMSLHSHRTLTKTPTLTNLLSIATVYAARDDQSPLSPRPYLWAGTPMYGENAS